MNTVPNVLQKPLDSLTFGELLLMLPSETLFYNWVLNVKRIPIRTFLQFDYETRLRYVVSYIRSVVLP